MVARPARSPWSEGAIQVRVSRRRDADLQNLRAELSNRLDSVKHRLILNDIVIADREDPPGTHIGIQFRNMASEPVRFEVQSLDVVLAGTTQENPTFSTAGAVLAPNQNYFYWFPWLDGLRPAKGMKGEITYSVRYGHAEGDFCFRLTHRQELECVVDRLTGRMTAHVLDIEAPSVTYLRAEAQPD